MGWYAIKMNESIWNGFGGGNFDYGIGHEISEDGYHGETGDWHDRDWVAVMVKWVIGMVMLILFF